MKRSYLSLALAGMLFATACSQDQITGEIGGESVVTFTAELPSEVSSSRAYGEGTEATTLSYAIYEVGKKTPLIVGNDAVTFGSDLKAKFDVSLVNGMSYDVIFWADADTEEPIYKFNPDEQTISANYSLANQESYDAFYAVVKAMKVNGTAQKPVELFRPFAQLNIGTNDTDQAATAGLVVDKTQVEVEAYTVFNLYEEDVVEDSKTTITYAKSAKAEGEFPVANNAYLAMNYILVPEDYMPYDVTFTVYEGETAINTRTYTAVPLQRNYKTNIYGSLLTSTTEFNVEIKPAFVKEEDGSDKYNIYNVIVDGESYDNFAVAVEKAMELNKPVSFIQNVKIDADNTITIPAGKTLTLNLNGHTLTGVTDDADKNDDGNITSADNETMFDVRGTLNVYGYGSANSRAISNDEQNKGAITLSHKGANLGWNGCTEIFYVAENGALNVEDAILENYGGSDMAFAIDMVNASGTTGVTVTVNNSEIKSSYIPVRVFNNGSGMNNVTITNSTLQGTSRAFWVHIYSSKDNGNKGIKDATLNINIYNPDCNNEFIAKNPERIIEYGFDDEINFDEEGNQIYKLESVYYDEDETEVVEGVGMLDDNTYGVYNVNGIQWIAAQINGTSLTRSDLKHYEVNGNTIKLLEDIDLTGVTTNGDSFGPIGRYCSGQGVNNPFTGHFDGNGKTIKGIYQSGWDFGYEWGTTGYLGLFGYVKDATIENLTIEGMESVVEGGTLAAVAGRADGECTFKNIKVTNCKLGTYNNRCGGIVGWTGGYYKDEAQTEVACHFIFENIEICEDVVLGGLWGSFDSSIGGIMGQLNSAGTASFKNVTVSCRIDAYNDCTASYDYYLYRMCGMLIGQMTKTTTIDGSTYPDVAAYGIEFDNVTVNYGSWMNYHYCEPTPGLNGGRGMRVEPGFTYDGLPSDFDHTQCVDNHYNCIPFDQLFGGTQTACKGVKAWEGVTVKYPAEYTCTLCGTQHNEQ